MMWSPVNFEEGTPSVQADKKRKGASIKLRI